MKLAEATLNEEASSPRSPGPWDRRPENSVAGPPSRAPLQSGSWGRPSRGMSGTRVGIFFGLGISSVWKKVHTVSPRCPPRLLRPFSVPTHPRSNPRMSIGCILGVLGFPAPSARLAGKKKASAIKGPRTGVLLPRGQTASSRERGRLTVLYHVTSKGNPAVF